MKGAITRDMSLRHIKALRAIKELDISPYTASPDDDSYLLVKDPHSSSEFYFSVIDVDTNSPNGNFYTVEYFPYVEENLNPTSAKIEEKQFKLYFDSWKRLIELYATYLEESVQESIVEGYEDEYFAEFELVDEDADSHSYSASAQQNIEEFLKKVADRLRQYTDEESLSDDIISEINKLIEDIEQLIATQTRQTKRQVSNRIVNIMARCRKAAPKILKEISFEFVKSLLVDAAKALLGP